MIFVNDTGIDYSDGMTVSSLVETLKGIEDFKKFFIYDHTYAVIIEGCFINREYYDTTPVEDGASITLRGVSTGG